jgi:hypothetical protein
VEEFRSGRLDVDGETFDVTASDEHPGLHHLGWLTGRNPGYGFSCRRSDGHWSTEAQLVAQIRDLLANINPASGYLD